MLAGARHSGGERCDRRIDAARDHRYAGREPKPFGGRIRQRADDVAGRDQPRRHHRRRDPERVEHFGRPRAAPDVIDAADVARRRMIDGDLAGQRVDDERVGRQEVARAREDIRPVVAQPQHLRVAVVAVDAVAGDFGEARDVDRLAHPVHLSTRAAIHPDQARMQRLDSLVDRNARAAVKPADADRLQRIGRESRDRRFRLRNTVGDAFEDRVEPDVRPLLGPQGLRRIRPIAFRVLRDDATGGVAQQRLRALRADVDADDVRGHPVALTPCRW